MEEEEEMGEEHKQAFKAAHLVAFRMFGIPWLAFRVFVPRPTGPNVPRGRKSAHKRSRTKDLKLHGSEQIGFSLGLFARVSKRAAFLIFFYFSKSNTPAQLKLSHWSCTTELLPSL